MNENIKERWVKALRTSTLEDGTKIEQAKEYLRIEDEGNIAQCCLGVLCELAAVDGVVSRINADNNRLKGYQSNKDSSDYSYSILPWAVIEWAGLDSDHYKDYEVNEVKVMDEEEGKETLLTSLNDYEDYSFEQIAVVIEDQL